MRRINDSIVIQRQIIIGVSCICCGETKRFERLIGNSIVGDDIVYYRVTDEVVGETCKGWMTGPVILCPSCCSIIKKYNEAIEENNDESISARPL